ncbi:hypothetical protein C427_0763 [Paraglaciecola psychrophila 170]|uniref:Uncharacterized protein n=1 Tax=Paraglaciecola psychrophila 170 TaxID=1129794 RepID=K7ACS5_9ALTE|nr:hypothetical protein C427_0763 [Paraglaciecola psychrophila 170]GAC40077.1 hypothetical protein GPSY_4474 [Paraglaciecola psychrophila 170]
MEQILCQYFYSLKTVRYIILQDEIDDGCTVLVKNAYEITTVVR